MNQMNRRQVLAAGLGAVALAQAGRAMAGPAAKSPHAGHDKKVDPALAALAAAAAECVDSGSACLQHCLHSLGTGETMMAACSKTVVDMLAGARALVDLANSGSKHLKAAAALVADLASDCEAECRKHEAMHATCKRCAECCARLIAAARKI